MTFSSIIRHLEKLPLTLELLQKLKAQRTLSLTGISRLPKGLISSTLAQTLGNHLLIITASLEEA